jgi:hypothetical protein
MLIARRMSVCREDELPQDAQQACDDAQPMAALTR